MLCRREEYIIWTLDEKRVSARSHRELDRGGDVVGDLRQALLCCTKLSLMSTFAKSSREGNLPLDSVLDMLCWWNQVVNVLRKLRLAGRASKREDNAKSTPGRKVVDKGASALLTGDETITFTCARQMQHQDQFEHVLGPWGRRRGVGVSTAMLGI